MIIKIGIIGCGGIAENKHIPSLLKLKNKGVKIVALCDKNTENMNRLINKFHLTDILIYSDYEELIENDEVNLVHICTPNILHSIIAIKALEGGKDVFCEKPMAISTKQAIKMIEAEKMSGKKLTISYQNRFKNESIVLKKICEKDVLGKIYYAKAKAIRRRAIPTWGSFLNKNDQGGGALIDIGSHAIDLTLWLMGNFEPDYVMGNTYSVFGNQNDIVNLWGEFNSEKFEVEDSAFGSIKMKDGTIINIEASWALNSPSRQVGESKVELYGTKAGINNLDGILLNGELAGGLYEQKVETNLSKIEGYNEEVEDNGFKEIENWINYLLHGTGEVVSSYEAAVTTSVITAFYESAYIGEPVKLISSLEY